jgi:hypothetical protein
VNTSSLTSKIAKPEGVSRSTLLNKEVSKFILLQAQLIQKQNMILWEETNDGCTHTFLILVVPQVSSMQASFKWCHLVISFPSGSSQCGANKVKRIIPRRYAMIKRLQVISTSGNVTHLFYLLSFKLPPCMICSKLPCLTSL